METNVQEKLLRIIDEIDTRGHAELTRLTVLKKWFGRPGRLPAFAIWVAAKAGCNKGKTPAEATALFLATQALLSRVDPYAPRLSRKAAEDLWNRLKTFQDKYVRQQWGPVRMIENWDLMLVEKGLEIYLWLADSPSHGYKLAADYCQHYDPRHGTDLNGPSRGKIMEISRFMSRMEAQEVRRAVP